MNSIKDRFEFKIDLAKMDEVAWGVFILVWLVVLGCGISSVFVHRHRFTTKQRFFWIALMVCVPFFGVLAYLPVSVLKNGYSILKPAKKDVNKIKS